MAAAAVLLFAAQTAFCDTKFYRRPAFRPLTAALSQLLIQSVYLLYRPLSQWVLCRQPRRCWRQPRPC